MKLHRAMGPGVFAVCGLLACDGPPGTGPGGRAVLRSHLSVELATVASLAVVDADAPAGPGLAVVTRAVEPTPTGLVALTVGGEAVSVSFVEGGAGEPGVEAIHPTSSWILFSVRDFQVERDGEPLDCKTIAARRDDGALFCAPLRILPGNAGAMLEGATFQPTPGGALVYAVTGDEVGNHTLYRFDLAAAGGPAATLVEVPPIALTAVYGSTWFLPNATGDLFFHHVPDPLRPSVSVAQVLPLDGSPPFTLDTGDVIWALAGEPGGADEDTLYVLTGGKAGVPAPVTLRAVARGAGGFAETPLPLDVDSAGSCVALFRLEGGVHLFCLGISGDPLTRPGLVRVVAPGGAVVEVAAQELLPFVGVDQIFRFAAGGRHLVLLADGAGGALLVRHDGVTQEDIPLPAGVTPDRITVGSTGAIEFFGVDTGSGARVRGSVAADATAVVVHTADVIDADAVVVFTPIN